MASLVRPHLVAAMGQEVEGLGHGVEGDGFFEQSDRLIETTAARGDGAEAEDRHEGVGVLGQGRLEELFGSRRVRCAHGRERRCRPGSRNGSAWRRGRG